VKAYLVLDFSVRDLRGFMPYVSAIPAFIEKHGGKYILQGRQTDRDGRRLGAPADVILEFPSRQNAEAFLDDPDAQALFAIRHATTDSKLVLVDGCA
jgi:uncharacterized protein (DUF1330 family)